MVNAPGLNLVVQHLQRKRGWRIRMSETSSGATTGESQNHGRHAHRFPRRSAPRISPFGPCEST